MTPPSPSGSMGRRPVLDWSLVSESWTTCAEVGPLTLTVGDPGMNHRRCWWRVHVRATAFAEGEAPTIEEARLAAEEACKALLCQSLAAFADPDESSCEVDDGIVVLCHGAPFENDITIGYHPKDARRVAADLLRAAERASESASTGGER